MLKNLFRRELLLAALLVPLLALAQTRTPVAGKDYRGVQPPQPTDNPAKIEVLEFFAYTCPHCMRLATRVWRAPSRVHTAAIRP